MLSPEIQSYEILNGRNQNKLGEKSKNKRDTKSN